MNQEINRAGSEFNRPPHFQDHIEQLSSSAPEHITPAEEFAPLYDEFNLEPSPTSKATKRSRDKNKSAEGSRKFLTRMAGYGITCFFSLLILANSISNKEIQDNVIAAGGSVDGDMRFTIQWNDVEENQNDFDAHCIEPNGYELFYGNRGTKTQNGGTLDVDIIDPMDTVAIENIVYENRSDMEDGEYILSVNCYNNVGYDGGFRVQIELNGRIYNLQYNEPMDTGETVVVAVVTVKNGRFSIDTKIAKRFG